MADVLADVKPLNSNIGCRGLHDIFHFDAAYFSCGWTLTKARFEIFKKTCRARSERFHATVRQIANPALQSKLPGDAGGELTVPHTLHSPRYPELTRSHTGLAVNIICPAGALILSRPDNLHADSFRIDDVESSVQVIFRSCPARL